GGVEEEGVEDEEEGVVGIGLEEGGDPGGWGGDGERDGGRWGDGVVEGVDMREDEVSVDGVDVRGGMEVGVEMDGMVMVKWMEGGVWGGGR
ncbi:hypothetical protein, partial [Micrococcus luteus]|uniref:hypothetical protein n=1 Tax=Micrococcus luteus TaxID=1270 RepID=UPI001C92EA7C